MMRKKRKTVTTFAAALILALSITVLAYAEDWEGWTEDTKEEAWTVYTTTDWNSVSGLNFAVNSDGSIASADVPDDFREEYANVVRQVLEDNSLSTIYFNEENHRDKTCYSELLLAIGYTLYDHGNSLFEQEEVDVCYINEFVSTQYTVNSPKDSFDALFKRLVTAENFYRDNFLEVESEEPAQYSIYSNDEYLASVIQGVLYRGYSSQNETYSQSSAREYYENNESDILENWNEFADEVLDRYSAVRSSSDHSIVG